MKKRIVRLGLAIAVIIGILVGIPNVKAVAVTNYPTRVINVVYDDSVSMIRTTAKKEYVYTWCHAKYSLEVFAALMGEKDTVNVYFMSDYEADKGTSASPRLTLYGRDGAEKNVKKVHTNVSAALNTHFNSVRKAYSDLEAASADEKWLVILTDGKFQGTPSGGVDGFLSEKARDINVMFLGMGSDAQSIKADDSKNIFFEKAETTQDILKKITEICTRIYNINKLSVNLNSSTFSFDVPMSELIVFAQGASVDVEGVRTKSGNYLTGLSKPVEVLYSETAATNGGDNHDVSKVKIDKNLRGEVLTFRGDYDPGSYTVDVSGAETIEVYYKPNVSVAAYLYDQSGKLVEQGQTIKAGEYTMKFGLVKTGTNQPVPESELLGKIRYSATASQEGVNGGKAFTSGDKISLKDGRLDIDVVAKYLDYNTVSDHLTYDVFSDKEFIIEKTDHDPYIIEGDGISNGCEPFIVKIVGKGAPLTKDQWDRFEDISVYFDDSRYNSAFKFSVEKGDVGYLKLYPQINIENLTDELYTRSTIQVKMNLFSGSSRWTGFGSETVTFSDKRFKKISFDIEKDKDFTITKDGFSDDNEPWVVNCYLEGEEWTKDKWDVLSELEAEILEGRDSRVSIKTEKTDTPGKFLIYPEMNKKVSPDEYSDEKIRLSATGEKGIEKWSGSDEVRLGINDGRSWWAKYGKRIIRWSILLLLLILIAGYIPPFKKYLPKKLKIKPCIECKPQKAGRRASTESGSFNKKFSSTIIPYRRERGTLRFVPGDVTGVPIMRLKGVARKGRMMVTNVNEYSNVEGVMFGAKQPVGKKTMVIRANEILTYKTKDMKYECSPTSKKY